MVATRFDDLLRSLADPLGRRRLSRVLVGLAVGGPLSAFGLAETDARNKRKKKRRKRKKKRKQKDQSSCAGKDLCTDGVAPVCGDGKFDPCACRVVVGSGDAFCADLVPVAVEDCSQCGVEETCVVTCLGSAACARPCPNPL